VLQIAELRSVRRMVPPFDEFERGEARLDRREGIRRIVTTVQRGTVGSYRIGRRPESQMHELPPAGAIGDRQVLRRAAAAVGDVKGRRWGPLAEAKILGAESHRRDLAAPRPAGPGLGGWPAAPSRMGRLMAGPQWPRSQPTSPGVPAPQRRPLSTQGTVPGSTGAARSGRWGGAPGWSGTRRSARHR
jgi:hypothetical protein